MSGPIGKKRKAAKVKGRIYKRVVRPAMLFGLGTVLRPKRGGRAGGGRVKDIEILFFGVTRMDRIRNEPLYE